MRRKAGLSQDALAGLVGTSRAAVSAYEHGRKSSSLDTAERLLAGAGYELDARPTINFVRVDGSRGRTVLLPDRLPQLCVERALATVEVPVTVYAS